MKSHKISLLLPGPYHKARYFSIIIQKELRKMPQNYQMRDQMFVISNLNGDFNVLKKILIRHHIMNNKYEWIFESGRLIILGNCFNDQHLECLWLIYSLEEKARKKGGDVHFILGNKELENMQGDWKFQHPSYATRSKRPKSSLCVLYDGNGELYRWLNTKNVDEKIGEYLLIHDSLIPKDINLNDNTEVENTLLKFRVKRIIVGGMVGLDTTTLSNGKIINVSSITQGTVKNGLLIRENQFFLANVNGDLLKI